LGTLSTERVITGEFQITKEVNTFDGHIINWFRMRTGQYKMRGENIY
jgi:hypothetical protein